LRLISVSLLVVIYAVALLYISPMLTALALTAVVIMSLIAQVIVNRSRDIGIRLSLAVRGSYNAFIERIGMLRLVKMLGQEDAETKATAELSQRLMTANVDIVKAQALVEVVVDPGLMLGAFFALFVVPLP